MTIAEDYIPLARSLAKKYTPKGQHFETSDCLGVAYEALTQACGRADGRELGQTSYIKKRIEGALKRHLTTQRVQGFSGLKRSKYAEAILMEKELDTPEELQGPLSAALSTAMALDEPTAFADGVNGTLEETIDVGVPSIEDECVALETQSYLSQEVQDWLLRFKPREQLYIIEVMMGDKSQAQFCKDHHMSDVTAKKIRELVVAEGSESLSYVLYNLEETP